MDLANKSVVLYENIKVGKKWVLCPVDEDSSHFSDGPFYVSWYDGKKKQMDPAGRDPEHALRMVNLKRAALAYRFQLLSFWVTEMKRDSISLSVLAVAGVMMAFPTVLAGQYSQNEAATKVDSSNYPSDILRGYKTYEAKCSTCHQLGGLTRKLRAIPSQNKFWVMNMQARPSTNISDNEVTRILAYLAYDSSRQMSTVMDQNPADPMTAKMVAEGRQFFLSQSCNACHTVGADTASGGPPLDNVGHARNRQQLLDRIKRMCSGADKTMPPLPSDTPDEQVNALVDYLQTLKGKA